MTALAMMSILVMVKDSALIALNPLPLFAVLLYHPVILLKLAQGFVVTVQQTLLWLLVLHASVLLMGDYAMDRTHVMVLVNVSTHFLLKVQYAVLPNQSAMLKKFALV